jgi:hypothetical protein
VNSSVSAITGWLVLQIGRLEIFTSLKETDGGRIFFQLLFVLVICAAVLYLIIKTFARLFTMERLTRIHGIDQSKNRVAVRAIAEERKWRIACDEGRLFVAQTNSVYAASRILPVIFDNEDILVNVMTFGFGNLRSPVYFIKDKDAVELFSKHFIRHVGGVK